MQGIVFLGFRRFVREGFGDALWRSAQDKTGSAGRIYLPVQTYAYHELVQLVDSVAAATDTSPQKLLEEFGAFLAPDLVRIYATLLDPRWKLIDILANSDRIVLRAALLKRDELNAPLVHSQLTSSRDVLITFLSRQRICAMIRGVIRGLAAHLHEPVHIRESRCMLLGQRQCEITVTCQGIGATLGKRRTFPPGSMGQRSAPPGPTLLPPSDASAHMKGR